LKRTSRASRPSAGRSWWRSSGAARRRQSLPGTDLLPPRAGRPPSGPCSSRPPRRTGSRRQDAASSPCNGSELGAIWGSKSKPHSPRPARSTESRVQEPAPGTPARLRGAPREGSAPQGHRPQGSGSSSGRCGPCTVKPPQTATCEPACSPSPPEPWPAPPQKASRSPYSQAHAGPPSQHPTPGAPPGAL